MDPQLLTANKENSIDIKDFQEKDGVNNVNRYYDSQSVKSAWSGAGSGSGSGFDGDSFKGSFTQGHVTAEAETTINQNHEMPKSSPHSIARSESGAESDWEGSSLRRSGSINLGSTSVEPVQSARRTAAGSRITRKVRLDPDKPGAWIIEHHEQNIITKLLSPGEKMPPKPKSPKSTPSKKKSFIIPKLSELFRGWVYGTNAHNDEEASQNEKTGRDKEAAETIYDPRFRVSFAEMQRMKMRKLQIKLVKNAVDMSETGSEPNEWEDNLSKYVQALKDYDYMNECSQRLKDPFLASGEHFVDYWVIKKAMNSAKHPQQFLARNFDPSPSLASWKGPEDANPIGGLRGETVRNARIKGFLKRLAIAACGGAFLIGPMWLMVLHHTKYTALVTTTVCVVVFGFVMAWFLEKEIDVLSSTAAYAAVLVVFVGLNT